MLYLAVLWSYVTDAVLMLRRWRQGRTQRKVTELSAYMHPEAYGLPPDVSRESVHEWFNRTEAKTIADLKDEVARLREERNHYREKALLPGSPDHG